MGTGVAAAPRGHPGARWHLDLRRHELPQTGQTLGGGRTAVLRRGRQDRELSGGDDRTLVGAGAGLVAGGGVISAERVDARSGAVRTRWRAAHDSLSREMAVGVDPRAPGARRPA